MGLSSTSVYVALKRNQGALRSSQAIRFTPMQDGLEKFFIATDELESKNSKFWSGRDQRPPCTKSACVLLVALPFRSGAVR
jgi:hypothetical protein